jgi:hypothetical protein
VTHRCTLHIEVDDPGELAAIVRAIEGLGHRVECPVFDEWSRLRQRDEFLREAHGFMSGTTWGKCQQLAVQIGKFEDRWRDCETVPETFGALGRCLFRARGLGALPTTPEQLRNIIAKFKGRCNLVEKPFSSAPDPE